MIKTIPWWKQLVPKENENITEHISEPSRLTQPKASETDLELVAVIAAAIAEASGIPADGFVVRSIKRR